MHILVEEALIIATYSTWEWANTYTHRKPCRSRTCLVRIAGPCPAVPFQLVPVQLRHTNVWAYERTNVRAYEPANSHRDAAYSQHQLATVPYLETRWVIALRWKYLAILLRHS